MKRNTPIGKPVITVKATPVPVIVMKEEPRYYVEVHAKEKHLRICRGPFDTREEAQAFLQNFEKQWYLPPTK